MSLQWFEWHTAKERFQGRLHALAKTGNYAFNFDLGIGSGVIDFATSRIAVNPLSLNEVFKAEGLKGRQLDEANYLSSRALLGHEALHADYTDPADIRASSKDKDHHMVMNLLEDARIEGIGAEQSHVSKQLFKLYSAGAMKMMPAFNDPDLADPYSAIQLLQYWREGYAIPQISDEARKKWIELRNMAEDALYAPTSRDVLHISQKVCEYLGLGKNKPPDQQPSDLGKQMQDQSDQRSSQIKGNSKRKPKENPREDPRPNDQKGEGNPQQDDDDQQQQGSGGQDQQDQPQDQQGGQGSGGSKPDDTDQQDGKGSGGQPNDDDQQPDDQSDAGGNGQGDKGNQDGNGRGPDQNDPADDPSWGRDQDPNVNLKDAVNNCQSAVKDGIGDDVPKGDLRQLLQGAAKSDPSAHRNHDIIGRPYLDLYELAKPLTKEFIKELKADDPKAVRGASEYPGRVRMRYLFRDENKPFAKNNTTGKNIPKMAVTIVLDRSESMRGRVQELRIMAMAIYLACEELKIPLAIWVLEGQIQLKAHDEWGAHILAKIAGIEAITYTNMTPTLTSASDELRRRPEPLRQLVVIHDGGPGDRPNVIKWRKNLGRVSHYCMLIVPGDKSSGIQLPRKDDGMDELFAPGNYCIGFMEEIPKFWCSFIKLKRKALAVAA